MQDISDVILASVVPPLTPVFQALASQYLGCEAIVITHRLDLGIRLLVDNPWETGADRMISTLAAHQIYGGPAIVIQFGTATSFDCVSPEVISSAARLPPAWASPRRRWRAPHRDSIRSIPARELLPS